MTNEVDSLTAQIVSAYVGNNSISAKELPLLIAEVRATFPNAAPVAPVAPVEGLKPAVAVKKSVTPSHIICLEDGKKFKSLTRHLRTHYDLTPDEYRLKWGLGRDYPMVAPEYAARRSQLAKDMGLGRRAA